MTLNGAPSDISDSKKKYINDYYVSYANIVSFPDVWIINPENGNAYKAILCDGSRKDAVSKANAEDAHLVTITSEEEQVWLDEVYEGMEYWTGLKYDMGENRWEWDSGEPFSYMNWDMSDISTPRFADPNAISKDTNNYAILSRKGKWERVREKGTTRMAVIEKDKFKTKSVKDKD